jgi:hypothetical protein
MAAVNLLTFSILDERGTRGQVNIFVPTGLTLAQYEAFVTAAAPDVDAMTGGKVMSAALTLDIALPAGLKANPIADQFMEQGVNFPFSCNGTGYRHTVRVPAFRDTLITDGAVDVAAQSVIDWIATLTAGDAVVLPCDKYGNDIETDLGPYIAFRK